MTFDDANPCFVYVLKCADGTYYTGWTTNLARRVNEHNKGKASKYTRVRLPVEVAYIETVGTRSQALKREFAIKRMTRLEKENLIQAKFLAL